MMWLTDWLDRMMVTVAVSDRRVVVTPEGEHLQVARVGGEWSYFYDNEWIPLRYYGGPLQHASIQGDRLIVQGSD